ncbi:cysteine-rich venom protein kaouthin-2-like [Gigantopelta aegis]|uniref:cysteine-rich venom protein kaouthin-2-like n=1 Tax=Gigantopelta aegis TaxID=1735272 RepID=UPI001B88BEB1|nr:cysteine-rich venom protein kaouthin-2-like [Gigantopelta aegis]
MQLVSLSTMFFLIEVSNGLVHGVGSEHDLTSRTKRSINPCADKFRVIKGHTACLSGSVSTSLLDKVPQSDIDLIVNKHNEYRSNVSPTASNMLQMSWDVETAMIAQLWAEQCKLKHDSGDKRVIPGKFSLGQNIAMGATSWLEALTLWENEKTKFHFGTGNNFEEVGHYTQMVWANTNKVGCGVAKCGTSNFHVCNYGPAGNNGNYSIPYKTGTPCDGCKTCEGGKLCECRLTCLNGGTLNLSSCTCRCRQNWSFYVFHNCSMDCSRVKTDPSVCQTDYGSNSCGLIANDCPNKCKFCPYSSFNYTKEATAVLRNQNQISCLCFPSYGLQRFTPSSSYNMQD